MSGPGRPRRPLIEALEPRMLFSATADIAVFDDGSSDPDYLAQASQSVDLTQIYPHIISAEDSAPDAIAADIPNAKPLDILVVVDTSVKDYEVLVNDIRQNHGNESLDIIYIEPGADGIARITEALTHYTDINSVHLISHSDTDSLQLGTVSLSIGTLAGREFEIAKWRDALADEADILLYGCNIAATDTGRNLLEKLSEITQADIAASNDVTGHKSLGGDWDLEYSRGDIESSVIVSQQAQDEWQHTLTVLETSGAGPDTLFVKSDAQAYQSFVHTGGSGTYIVNEISLQMMRNQFADQTAQTVTVSLLSGSYNGTVLASTVISSTALSTTMSWVDFSVGSQSLTYGQTYYIKVTTNSTVQLVQLGIHNTDAYAGGNFVTHFGVTDNTRDLGFEVSSNNSPPIVANAIPNRNATEDSVFSYQFASNTFSDPNGNTLTYSAQLAGGGSLPSWLSFNSATRTFSGTPLNANVGTVSIDVIANDGNGGTVTDTFDITVANTNDAPTVANAIPNQNATEDSVFSYQFPSNTFADVDAGATLTYSAQLAGGGSLPSWLSFNSATRTFSGTPLNANVGTVSIDVIANDGNGGTVTDTFNIVVANTNDAPTVANAIPNQNATEDSAFNFQFASNTFSDVDTGTTLTYSAQLAGGGSLPSWLSFNAATRTFSGTPLNTNVGAVSIDVIASDGNGGTVTDTFNIVVANTNDAPTVANAIPNQNATEDSAFNFQFASNTFADVDAGATLTYSAQLAGGGSLPSWLSFNAATRTFSGTPLNANVGTVSIDVIASDGNGGTVTDTFDITVANTNDAPTVANAIPNQNATEDSAFNFQFASNTFNDQDVGNTLTYSAQLAGGGALPSWLSFNSATRTFSGTPLNANVGTVSIDVIASDGNGGTITDTFDITVANTNDAPTVANAIPNQNATEDSAFNFQFASNTFTDSDAGFTLTYSAQLAGGGSLPSWLSFNAATRTFSGTPLNANVGTVSIDVIASDGNGGTVTDTFDITVANTNDAPTVANPITNQTATENSLFNFTFAVNTFSDPDVGNTLTYSAQLAGGGALPAWLSFDTNTRTFSGTPSNGDIGTVSVEVIANDGTTTVSDIFDLVVQNVGSTNFTYETSGPSVDTIVLSPGQSLYQTFTHNVGSGTYTIDSIILQLQKDPGAQLQTITVSLMQTFNGAVIASGTMSSADIDTTLGWEAFDFTNLVLTVGQEYFVKVEASGSDGLIRAGIHNTNVYPNGQLYYDSGTPDANRDLAFQVASGINTDPAIANPIPNQNATEDAAFNFQFASNTFSDADVGDTLTYSATMADGSALPTWLSFNAATRTFSGTPTNDDVGTISIRVTADDGNGGTPASDTFDISIANTNDAPTVANPIANQNAVEGAAFNFTFAANTFTDVDTGNSLTYSAQLSGGSPLPGWLNFNSATRTFSGVPDDADVGTLTIEVIADDGNGGTVTDTFQLNVANVNDDPFLNIPIPDQNATEDSPFNYAFPGNTFGDGDISASFSYTAQLSGGGALPSWLSFDSSTRTFSGTPVNADVGTISIEVTMDDGNGGTASDTFDIVIANTNDVPTVANPIVNQNATEATSFNFQFASNTFNDVDASDTLTYTATLSGGGALPSWLAFDAATRTFSGVPTTADIGTITIDVAADDGNGGTVTDSFTLTVATLDDTNYIDTGDGGHFYPVSSGNQLGQSFSFDSAGSTYTVNEISLYLARYGSALPQTITVELRDAWNGAVIATDSIASSQISDTGFEWHSFDFSDVVLNDNQSYVIRISTDANDDSILVSRFDSDTFANGALIQNGVADTAGWDLAFKVSKDDGLNSAPILDNPISNQTINAESPFNLVVPANTFSDLDANDTLTYRAQLVGGGSLDWLTFNEITRTFSGTPHWHQAGTMQVELIATDNHGASTSAIFDIDVINTNNPPTVANPIPDQNATEDAVFNFQFASNTFDDLDANTFTYTAQLAGGGGLPVWLSFDAVTRTFSGTPANEDVGSWNIDVIANDGFGGTVTDTFSIVVGNTNDTPVLDNLIPNQNATEDTAFNFQIAANTFSDVDVGDVLAYSAQLSGGGALPTWLSFDSATRTFSGTPANSDVGTISIEVTAADGNGGTVSDTFDIVVANTNDAPNVANPIADQNAIEDAAFNYQFAANTFVDADLDTLTYSAQLAGGGALPAWMSFDAATRTFSGTPANADVGTVSIDIIADDGNGGTVTDTFNIVIANTNDAPTVANAIPNQNATEDTAFNFQFAANTFGDPDVGDTLAYSAQLAGGGALPSWLSFDAATRTFSGIPTNSDIGTVSIDVIADDGNGGTVAETFDIVIANSNDAPTIANPITDQSATEDAAFNFQFAANTFSDADLDTLTYSAQLTGGGALPAWLSFDPVTRTFSGTPANIDVGTLSIDVIADDGNGGTVTDTFNIVIVNTNDVPIIANAIPNQNATEDSVFNFQFSANTFSDPDVGDTLNYSAQLAGGGALPSWLSFDAATRTFSGTPTNADVGTISIDVIASDGNGEMVTDNFTIAVGNSNDAPTVSNVIPNQNATEDAVFNFQFAANTFADADLDSLTYSAQLAGGGALPTWLSFDAATRTFSGTPANGDVGTLSIDVTANDGNSGTVTDTFTITIANTNDAPIVANAIPNQNATEDTVFNFQIAANTFADSDLDALTYTAQLAGGGSLPSWLSFDAATCTFSGTPANADVGTISIEVIATDGNGGSATDTFDIVVINTNDVPTVANAIPDQNAAEDTPFNFVLPTNTFYDLDAGDVLTYSAQLAGGGALPAWLSFDAATGAFSGTPTETDVGTVVVEVIATDTGGESVYDAFNIVIAAVNDAPTTTGLNAINNLEDAAGNQVNLWLTFNDQEESSNNLTYTVISNTNSALVTGATIDQATGQLQLVYGANQFGTAQLVIRAQDSQGAIVETPLVINIAAVNDNPLGGVLADIQANAGQAPLQINLHNFFSDIEDGTNLTFSVQGNSNTQIVPQIQINQTTGQMTLVFASTAGGETTIVLRAQDSAGAWVDVNFKVTLVPVATNPGGETPGTNPPDTPTPPVVQPPIISPPITNPPTNELPDDEGGVINPPNPPAQVDDPAINNPGDSGGVLVGDADERGNFTQPDDKSSRDYQRYEQLQGQSANGIGLLTASAGTSLISPDAGFMPWELADFDNEMRRMREQMDEAVADDERKKAAIAGVTFSVTTGLLIWSLRASSLLLTLFSMLPLWRGMDPLPILEEVDKRKKELEQQRKDRLREDKSAKEVGYLFDNARAQDQGNYRS